MDEIPTEYDNWRGPTLAELKQMRRQARIDLAKATAKLIWAFFLLLMFLHILLFGFDGLVPLYFKYVQGVHP